MTSYIITLLVGIAIGFGLALWMNHKKPAKFDELTDKADRKVDEIRKK